MKAILISDEIKNAMQDGIADRLTKDKTHLKYDKITMSATKVVFSYRGNDVAWIAAPNIDTKAGETLTICDLKGKVPFSLRD